MGQYKTAKLLKYKQSYTCQMCGKPKFSKVYKYQAYSFVSRYKPPVMDKVCVDCIYKEVFGNSWKIKKREGVLDDL